MKPKVLLAAAAAIALLAGEAIAEEMPNARFGTIMDSVFGAGNWRLTGGYRTPERENELRRQGALTVRPGALSRHSTGRPEAPGAYDVVVPGLSPSAAAARLRQAGAPFQKYQPKGTHGTQGPHLHIEPHSGGGFRQASAGAAAPRQQSVYFVSDPTPAELALAALHEDAVEDQAAAQLLLGEAYAEGRAVPRDLIAAYVWIALAATNGAAEPATREEATRALSALSGRMKAAEVAQARRFARPGTEDDAAAACASQAPPTGLILRISGRTVEPAGACDRPGAITGVPAGGR